MAERNWAVAIHRRDVPLEVELGEAVCRCLGELGQEAALVTDDDPAALEKDVLLLLVNLANLPCLSHRLRTAGSARPRTLLWQMDPLPPERLPRQAELAGLRAAAWRERLRLRRASHGLPRWRKLGTLLSLREWLYKRVSAPGYRRAARELGEDFDWRQVRSVLQAWASIRFARDEGWLDRVVVSTRQRQRFLAGRGMEAPFVPVGAYAELGRDKRRARDVDVLFLGGVKQGRRQAQIDRLRHGLGTLGLKLTVVTGGCHGEERTTLLNRTRILLNLHKYAWNPAWIRFVMAALCGTLVVSEPVEDEEPFVAGTHYVSAPEAEMPSVIRRLLDDPEACQRRTAAAAELCHGDLTLLRSVETICSLA